MREKNLKYYRGKPGYGARKYKVNETFFDKIDTEDKAYFLGLLYADGNISRDGCMTTLSLKESDKDILKKLNPLINFNRKLYYQIINRKNTENHYKLLVGSKYIWERLNKLGVVPNKTFKLKFPRWLKKSLYSHFIRGYFDGDGCVSIKKKPKDRDLTTSGICIVSTKNFCNSIKKIIKKELNINCKLFTRFPERKNNIRQLNFGGNRQVKKFLDYIYKDSNIYLNRKYKKYKKLSKMLQDHDNNPLKRRYYGT